MDTPTLNPKPLSPTRKGKVNIKGHSLRLSATGKWKKVLFWKWNIAQDGRNGKKKMRRVVRKKLRREVKFLRSRKRGWKQRSYWRVRAPVKTFTLLLRVESWAKLYGEEEYQNDSPAWMAANQYWGIQGNIWEIVTTIIYMYTNTNSQFITYFYNSIWCSP